MIECTVIDERLDVADVAEAVQNRASGALSLFVGTVRDRSSAPDRPGTVVRLEYEAYVPMAESELRTICGEAAERFGVKHLVVRHRVGSLELGEIAVVIGVGAPHRAEAFDACRYVIEELKKRVPIWKKEVFENDAVWVDPHP